MKKTLTLLFTLLSFFAFAQVPQGISYQAVAFDSDGSPVTNGNVGVRISILDNSATGTTVYSETHTEATNSQGLFNLNIGEGSATTGNFPAINWGVNSKFLKVEVDPSGGTDYTNVGTNQLMSVPYALFAEKSNQSGVVDINSEIVDAKSANFAFNDYSEDKVYVYNTMLDTWTSQSYNYIGSISDFNGNFIFNDSGDDKIYIYNSKLVTWASQSYSYIGGVLIDTIKGNVIFNDFNEDKFHLYNMDIGEWTSQSYTYTGGVIQSKGNFAFNDYSEDKVYVYNSNTHTWTSQSYNYIGAVKGTNGNFYFNDSGDDKMYIFNAQTGAWSSQPYTYTGALIISEIK